MTPQAFTPIGEKCVERLSVIDEVYDSQISEVYRKIASDRGITRLGFFSAFLKEQLLNPLLEAVQSEFPEIEVFLGRRARR